MITATTRQEFLFTLKGYLPEYSIGVEIGVLQGDFSKQIIDIINPNQLLLIDPYVESGKWYNEIGKHTSYSTENDYNKTIQRFTPEIKAGQVEIIRNFSNRVVNLFEHYVFDFIYHDASHLYDDIKKDLDEWLPKLKEGGIMCGHDYIKHEDFGVIQAVDEFCNEHNFEMIILNQNGGDFALCSNNDK